MHRETKYKLLTILVDKESKKLSKKYNTPNIQVHIETTGVDMYRKPNVLTSVFKVDDNIISTFNHNCRVDKLISTTGRTLTVGAKQIIAELEDRAKAQDSFKLLMLGF